MRSPRPNSDICTSDKEALAARLERIEGQVRGVNRMVDDDRYCIDVVTQIVAIQAALDKVAVELLEDRTSRWMAGQADAEERTAELMGALKRLVHH